MAYDQRLVNIGYQGIPSNKRNLAEMINQSINQDLEIARQNAATRQASYTGDNMEMTRDQNAAIQPAVMQQLGQESQGMMHPAAMAQQAQTAPQDPYATQAQVMADRQALLQGNQAHPAALAMSPVLAGINKQKEANITGRGDLAGDQFALQSNRDFAAAIPDLDAIKQAGVKAMRGASSTKSIDAYNGMVSAVQSALVAKAPHLLQSKAYQDYMRDLEKLKPTPQPNSGVISTMLPPSSVLDNAAKRIANRESTLSEEINKGRFAGSQAMQIHDDLVQRVTALDPTFSESDTEAGRAFATNPSTRRALAQMDNAYSTIARLKDVYAKLDNGEFPSINKAINAGKVGTGDVEAARASIAEVLGNDELTQAFSRGGVGSDKLRDMSAALANYNLSPKQMAAQFDELMHGLKRSRNAYSTQGGGYIKDLKDAPAGAATKPASKAEFDALPSGSLWTDSKGETHRKK